MTTLTYRFQDGSFRGHRRAISAASPWNRGAAALGDLVTMLLVWHDRARERRELLRLSDLELHDIGISRADARREGDKPFWHA